jgi:two-component system, OmpR family, sensor histidine kinase VicK
MHSHLASILKLSVKLGYKKMENFTGQIQLAQIRLEKMEKLAQEFSTPPPHLLEQLFGELSMALEELHVATEELQDQNQELLSTREQVEIERERYKKLFEDAPDPYLVTNAAGVIEEANTAAENLFNWPRSFICDKPLTVFVASTERKEFRIQLEQLRILGAITEWEIQMLASNRVSFPAAISVSAIHDHFGHPTGFRWLIRDITDLKEAEKNRQELVVQKELHRIKSRFIQILSQEFRTPLNTIHLCTQLLERYSEGVKQSKRQPLFEKIRSAIQQMTLLLEDVLIFNGDKDSCSFHPFQLDLKRYCLNLIDEYKKLYNPGDRSIHFQASGDYHMACINTKLLRHILLNLLSNAFKFSPEQSQIDMEVQTRDGVTLFTIRDRGIGIPPEDLPHLFEIFYRGSNVGDISGPGLGLAIVKKAVDLLSGTLAIESSIGVGTTVTVTLPTTPTLKSPPVIKRQSHLTLE